jgi:hypothetical protein
MIDVPMVGRDSIIASWNLRMQGEDVMVLFYEH